MNVVVRPENDLCFNVTPQKMVFEVWPYIVKREISKDDDAGLRLNRLVGVLDLSDQADEAGKASRRVGPEAV